MASNTTDHHATGNTPEYQVFQENYELLIDTMKVDLGAFCDALFERGYISSDVRDYARIPSILNTDKARKLVDTVIDQIKHNPSTFHGFLELLKKPSTDYVHCKLQENFSKKRSTDSLFPCPKVSLHMDDEAVNDLHKKLISDTTKIVGKFSEFSLQTRKSLESQHVSLASIKHCILNLGAFSVDNGVKVIDLENKEKLNAASCLSEVFSILHLYISFFNYLILEHIIEQHGSASDKNRLEEYLAALHEFCQRSVFEVPTSFFSCQRQSATRKLIIQCIEGVVTLGDVQLLRRKIAQVLGLHPSALQLCFIKKGSVELHFLISAAVADSIFSVSPSQHSALSEIGVSLTIPSFEAVKPTYKDEDKVSKEELSSYLQSHGFHDHEFWLAELNELGVQSKESLLHLEGDMKILSMLKPKARNPEEEMALLSLMDIASNSLKNVLLTLPQQMKKLSNHHPLDYQDNPDSLALLKKLGLKKYYPKGLQMRDAMCIRLEPLELSLDKRCFNDPEKLPNLVMHKLMAYDLKCRSDLVPITITEEANTSSDENMSENSEDLSEGTHPVDCLLSLIICSDDFLRQDLFSRLAKCQLAVPFILPDPFTKELTIPLWGLRSIIKEWEYIKEKDEIIKKTQPIISYKMPIVTFIRLGKHQEHVRSKSAILNEVISDSHYDHFFHRDCEGGDYNLVLGDGLVDMCWYLPGMTNNTFPDAVTFLNLHGDAREHPEQMKFLSQISSMCFVLLTEEGLKLDDVTTESLKQFDSSAGGITVFSNNKEIPKWVKKEEVISLKRKNVSRIKEAIQLNINRKWSEATTLQSIEESCSNFKTKILIDQNSDSYRKGLSHASNIVRHSTCKLSNKSNVIDSLLPLQSTSLWRAWAAYDKESKWQTQRGNKSVNAYSVEIASKKAAIRKQQLEYVRSLTPVMEFFIRSLLTLGGPSNSIFRDYFLQCLKLELNDISRESISDLQYQYQSTRKKLSESQSADKSIIEDLKNKLENLLKDIINSSLGPEHFLRELGQVYEAAASKPQDYGDSLSRLPKAAAELLIDGYPLELMDGDAAHVPLQWVTAVLDETTKMLDDPNVFVLSVLGLQSTGKSTLLNTVFGLQFKVSAGRCTHGAFMQLLPLDDGLRKQTKFSYVLIVDTEGLRAPQLDQLKTQRHDNELATFVIGLANMTLINIYGEVAGDMDDILQTSVYAFLRMSEVNLSPSCQFVYQNAGNSLDSVVGRAKFVEKLNQLTIAAAREEHCEKIFTCFNDVIKFNDQSDVYYFPGLWKGDPPMAPVNKGYSQSAQKLKLHLVETLHTVSSSKEDDDSLSLSSFKCKVKNLWKTLLTENFVFSFKNIQEITAYNSLETEYSKWDWEFREAIMKWEQVAENEIKAAKVEDAAELAREKCKELRVSMPSAHKSIEVKMEAFFNGKQSEILVQWKKKTEKRFEDRTNLLREQAERRMRLGESRQAISQFEQNRKSFTTKITRQVPRHVASIKRKEQEEFHELVCNKRELNEEQLQRILKRETFTSEMLKSYEKQTLISEDQVKLIQTVIENCNGQLTAAALADIMFGEILTLEQVEQILLKGRQTTEELEVEFNKIWIECIKEFELLVPTRVVVDIESEVESAMNYFVRTKGYEGKLIEKRAKDDKSIRAWGAYLEFQPIEKVHFNKVKAYSWSTRFPGPIKKLMYYFQDGTLKAEALDPCQAEVVVIKEAAVKKALDYLNRITKQRTDFKTEFTQDLLERVDSSITEEAEQFKDHLTITHEFRLTVFLKVCGYALPYFEGMARTFVKETNPRIYLEKHERKPLFIEFKKEYYQIKAEEAMVSTLCTRLEVAIRDQIKNTIGAVMVGQMKATAHHFSSKMALKVKILADLYNEKFFWSYLDYLKDTKKFLQKRIKEYTVQYCDQRLSDRTRLEITAKAEVNRLIQVVMRIVSEINNPNIKEWLTSFSTHSDLISNFGFINVENLFNGLDSPNELNLDNFISQIQRGLDELKRILHATYDGIKCEEAIDQWRDKPHDLLADLIGCTEQCPFCGEQCDLQNPDHYKQDISQRHRTVVHRPSCLAEWILVTTQEMEIDFCTSLVASEKEFQNNKTARKWHPYKQYTSIYPEWSIPPDPSADTSLYWKWFLAKYSQVLAKDLFAEPHVVPSSWSDITWPEIKESLEDAYKVKVPSS